MSDASFFQTYLSYVGETEAPMFYHRWSALSMIGAFLGRDFYLPFGHSTLYPNMYVMLIGEPGTRKSTAIKLAKKVITSAGYKSISSDKTSKEKFILDLAEQNTPTNVDDILDTNLWGEAQEGEYSEMYIACDEFNDFIGLGNLEFISLLGNLWDFSGTFTLRNKNSKSVSVQDPTISILGGNTATSFANAFPPDVLGQGFFSRLLLIYGEPTGKKIPFPEAPTLEQVAGVTEGLQKIKLSCSGAAEISSGAKELLEYIYLNAEGIEDPRFISYSNRRFTHLLKLTLLIAASHFSNVIERDHVVEANTLLTHTENLMPKALGHFGRARNAEVTHKIMATLRGNGGPMSMQDIWGILHADLNSIGELVEQMKNLMYSQSVLSHDGKFLYKARKVSLQDSTGVEYKYLTEEEKQMGE